MAQDANEPPRVRGPPPGATEAPEHVKKPQVYEIFHGSSRGGQEELPTPASQPADDTKNPSSARPTLKEGLQSIKADDFLNVHKIPCARQGFLTGIGTGAVVGMGRYVFGARIPKAANWAFGAFLLGSVIQFEVCQAQRYQERAAMARVVEVIDRKQAEKKAKAEEAARLRREAAEKKAAGEAAAKKSWYTFW
ncbi:hypothetical protein DL765_009024 [Monosporascus sp. GIB2]|nr:hypothetical protein DL765_009024 [Monosporascus sp. GIB2]